MSDKRWTSARNGEQTAIPSVNDAAEVDTTDLRVAGTNDRRTSGVSGTLDERPSSQSEQTSIGTDYADRPSERVEMAAGEEAIKLFTQRRRWNTT